MVDQVRARGKFVALPAMPKGPITGGGGAYGHPAYTRFVRISPVHLTPAMPDDAGQDLVTDKEFWLWPFQTRLVNTGVCIEMPCGVYGQVIGKSSLAAKAVGPLGGVIDPSYRGEIIVVLH